MIGLHFFSQQLLLPKTARHKDGGQALDLKTTALKTDSNKPMNLGIL